MNVQDLLGMRLKRNTNIVRKQACPDQGHV